MHSFILKIALNQKAWMNCSYVKHVIMLGAYMM